MTNEEGGTFTGLCGTFLFYDNDVKLVLVGGMYIQLPENISKLNDYMCGPMNRKDRMCSECIDGFAPSVTSSGYECSNCTDNWYGIPLYLFLEIFPITIFYYNNSYVSNQCDLSSHDLLCDVQSTSS